MSASESGNYALLDQLAEEFAARLRAGERPSLQEYLDRYPDLADDLRELFPAMAEIEQAKAAAKLHHTNIVPVFGTGEHDGTAYYVMQFIQGTGLDVVINELARMGPGSRTLAGTVPVAHSPRREVSAIANSLLTGAYHPA